MNDLTERMDRVVDGICKDIRENPDNWRYKVDYLKEGCLKAKEGSYLGMTLDFSEEREVTAGAGIRIFTSPQMVRLEEAYRDYNQQLSYKIEQKAKQDFINKYGGKHV